jgi:hypothetical protein
MRSREDTLPLDPSSLTECGCGTPPNHLVCDCPPAFSDEDAEIAARAIARRETLS